MGISAMYTCVLGILCLESSSGIEHPHQQTSVILKVPVAGLCCALSEYWRHAQSIPPGRMCSVFLIPAVKAGSRVLKLRANAFPLRRMSLWRVLGIRALGKKKHHCLPLNFVSLINISVQETD